MEFVDAHHLLLEYSATASKLSRLWSAVNTPEVKDFFVPYDEIDWANLCLHYKKSFEEQEEEADESTSEDETDDEASPKRQRAEPEDDDVVYIETSHAPETPKAAPAAPAARIEWKQ